MQLAGRGGMLSQHARQELFDRGRVKSPLGGHGLIENAPQRKDVGGRSNRAPSLYLLGGHITRGPDLRPLRRQDGLFTHKARYPKIQDGNVVGLSPYMES